MSSHTVSDYLLGRLAELGADTIFGVPGDYTLQLLDHIVEHGQVSWTGCTNELNAGYAADGYARIRGIGALCTTFGVGELSAINAIAGSYAEYVPVVHIVGAPASGVQAAQRVVHHSLGDGIFSHFLDMHVPVTCARAVLTPATAAAEIDRVLGAVRDQHLPGYLLLPADLAEAPCPPPAEPLPAPAPVTDPATLEAFTDAARRLLATARTPQDLGLLAGLLVHRLAATAQLNAVLAAGPVPHASTLWAKSVVDENTPGFAGMYAGAISDPPAKAAIEDARVLILAGVQITDLNSGFFTQRVDRPHTIELAAAAASVGAATFAPLALPDALAALATLVAGLPPAAGDPAPVTTPEPAVVGDPGAPLSQAGLGEVVAGHLQPGDIVLADQGTAFYGAATYRLPADVTFVGQPLWASIGYTVPALLGACLADRARRGVLLVGDGAAQMTVQELSTVARQGAQATVIVLDNSGYTVERAIHGPEQAYNDIAAWDWTALGAVFAAAGEPVTACRATTIGELTAALAGPARAPGLTLIQAILPPLDVPPLLAALARAAAAANTRRTSS
jgi:TPP-dependent 2-oxoacid decarboxylase